MTPSKSAIATIEEWFAAKFPERSVESGLIDNDTVLLRASAFKQPPFELAISFEAFEDHEPAAILDDLERGGIAEAFRIDPTPRRLYDRFRRIRSIPRTV